MATVGKGNKRKIYFTQSTGQIGDGKSPAKEIRVASPWKAGKSRNKYKPSMF